MPGPVVLDHNRRPVEIARNLYLEAPAFRGEARVMSEGAEMVRAAATLPETVRAIEDALAEHDIATENLVSLDVVARESAMLGESTRSTLTGEAAQRLIMEEPAPDRDYALLYTDEAGISRWIFPDQQPHDRVEALVRSDSPAITFDFPMSGASPDAAAHETRSLTIGSDRLVRVVSWAAEPLVGHTAKWIAKQWETSQRPYGLWQLIDSGTPTPIWKERPLDSGDFWRELSSAGPALLFLHGTFSNAQSGFAGLLKMPQLQRLRDHYGDRLLAFNHPSLHHDPTQNVSTLLEAIPASVPLEFDLIGHSRGCLVGRALAEGVSPVRRPDVNVRRALFLAGPHRGTVLASRDKWTALVDRLTNLFSVLPPTQFSTLVEGILTVVKIIGRGALGSLPGLTALSPRGKYLKTLNQGRAQGATYFAVAADFTPSDPSLAALLLKRAGDELRDRFFDEDNDGVVPTVGSVETGITGVDFPIPEERTLLLDETAHVHHSLYFATSAVADRLASWLVQ